MKLKGEVFEIKNAGDFALVTIGNVTGNRDAKWRQYRTSVAVSTTFAEAKSIRIGRKAEVIVKFK